MVVNRRVLVAVAVLSTGVLFASVIILGARGSPGESRNFSTPSSPLTTAVTTAVALSPKRVLFIGDGSLGSPGTNDQFFRAIADSGIDTDVYAYPETGYSYPGPRSEGNLQSRFARESGVTHPDLIVLYGGSVDVNLSQLTLFHDVNKMFDFVVKAFPATDVVMLGPAHTSVRETVRLSKVNSTLSRAAGEPNVPYINVMAQEWLANIDPQLPPVGEPGSFGYLSSTALNAVSSRFIEILLGKVELFN